MFTQRKRWSGDKDSSLGVGKGDTVLLPGNQIG